MPIRQLPLPPNLDHLEQQVKDLLQQHQSKDRSCAQRLREFHPRLGSAPDQEIFLCGLSLSDAQLAIARECGFSSWSRLKEHIQKPGVADDRSLPHQDRIEDPIFRDAVHLIDSGDAVALALLLREHPNLINQRTNFEGENYFRNPGLLEFIAENPVRTGTLPQNILQIATILLEAGPEPGFLNDTLALVASGRIARERGVQLALIKVLCGYGADPKTGLDTALLYGEFEAVDELIRLGAQPDLPVCAATGDEKEFLLRLSASHPTQRQLALALAAQYGHLEIVRTLLDQGVDPNRYGCGHRHSTPLHQAALAGHLNVVKLLVERGAELNTRDTLWNGTPADWAEHAGHTSVERLLREWQKHHGEPPVTA